MPQLTLTVGDNSTYPVNYSSGSGTLSLNFAYTVQAGHNSSDLDYAATTSLGANGATIVDVAGNSATLTLASPGATNSLGSARNYVIDTTSPTMTITVSPDVDGSTSNDGTLAVTFISDEATTNFVSGDVTVTNGSINDTFVASGNAGTTYTATFTPDDDGATTIKVASSKFTDAVGNANTESNTITWTFDSTVPTVTGVIVAGGDDNYKEDEDVTILSLIHI